MRVRRPAWCLWTRVSAFVCRTRRSLAKKLVARAGGRGRRLQRICVEPRLSHTWRNGRSMCLSLATANTQAYHRLDYAHGAKTTLTVLLREMADNGNCK